MLKRWVGVDLDGTLVPGDDDPSTWNIYEVKPPIQAMVDKVNAVLALGIKVKIFTARVAGLRSDNHSVRRQAKQIVEIIQAWSVGVFGHPLEVTAEKDMDMIEYWDDRARQVVWNTGEIVGEHVGQ